MYLCLHSCLRNISSLKHWTYDFVFIFFTFSVPSFAELSTVFSAYSCSPLPSTSGQIHCCWAASNFLNNNYSICALPRMLSISAPVCSHAIHVGSGPGQSQSRIGSSTKGYVFRISAMSDLSNQNSENPQHHSAQIPKLEPFNMGRIRRGIKEPSLLEKAENAIMDHCSSLEGEESYECWETLFEFEKMKEECEVQCNTASSENRATDCRPLERIENMVRQSGGVKSLIDNVSMVAKTSKLHKDVQTQEQTRVPIPEPLAEDAECSKRRAFPEPEDLPKTEEELEEEEKARMPDSPYTKMLRLRQIGNLASFRS